VLGASGTQINAGVDWLSSWCDIAEIFHNIITWRLDFAPNDSYLKFHKHLRLYTFAIITLKENFNSLYCIMANNTFCTGGV
jgi:hypothetical protein